MSTSNTNTHLKPKTVKGLLALASTVLANAKHYDQNQFYSEFTDKGCLAYMYVKMTTEGHPKAMAKLLKAADAWRTWKSELLDHPFVSRAKKGLGLTDQQAFRIFGALSDWPGEYRDRYDRATDKRGRARAAAAFLKNFVKTDGALLAPPAPEPGPEDDYLADNDESLC